MTERTPLYVCTQLWGGENQLFDEIAFLIIIITYIGDD